MFVFWIGLLVEGIKVGFLDEFDFVLCIEEFKKIMDIILIKECVEKGFVCLKFL